MGIIVDALVKRVKDRLIRHTDEVRATSDFVLQVIQEVTRVIRLQGRWMINQHQQAVLDAAEDYTASGSVEDGLILSQAVREYKANRKHILYATGDVNVPSIICDRNGDVCLGMCQVCGLAEVQLDETPVCPGRRSH